MDISIDWKWQFKNIIKNSEELSRYVELSAEQKDNIDSVSAFYKMGITPYLAELLNFEAIYRQFVPDSSELFNNKMFFCDPLDENINSPLPRLVHKFKDRVAIFVCDLCFSYCRHCTRKNTLIKGNGTITDNEISGIVDYLKNATQVTDVLITGGDPFVLDDDVLDNILSQIRTVPHISTIRIGTRSIVTAPMRITNELTSMLSNHHPLWIHTQFNHPDEITDSTVLACNNILSQGIPLNNQSVLLKDINNDFNTMKKLLLELIKLRIRPYYIYQCDYVLGTHHFMTNYTEGMDLIRDLWGVVPGYAIPKFIVDTSVGKINIEHCNIIAKEKNTLTLRAYNGEQYLYNI